MNKSKPEITNYLDIRDELCTFTIINCIHHRVPYNLIGHTAVIYKCPTTGQIMVLESTSLNKFTGISGVQLTPMGLWLKNYPGKVYIRIPEFAADVPAKWRRQKAASEFIGNHLGSSYPDLKTRTGRFKLYLAALDFKLFGVDWLTYKGDDDGIFCTMLVAMLYAYCGLLCDRYKDVHEYEPDDMRDARGRFQWELLDCELGNEIRIK